MANQPPRQPEIPIFESTDELIDKLKALRGRWIPSVKKAGNDGAVGNTLENLLNVDENNLPITNKDEWELKARRRSSSSLTTLLHNDPSPRGAKLIPLRLLPYYGWTHEKAGKIYPKTEKSFRSTTNAVSYTDRGFIVIVDRKEEMIRFSFNADKVDKNRHSEWLKSIEKTVGLGEISPQPFWVFKR